MIGPVARPAEKSRVLMTESVAQQSPTLIWGGGADCGGRFSGNLESHPHDRQLTGLLAVEQVSILAHSVVSLHRH